MHTPGVRATQALHVPHTPCSVEALGSITNSNAEHDAATRALPLLLKLESTLAHQQPPHATTAHVSL
jgi:hypothetical protein